MYVRISKLKFFFSVLFKIHLLFECSNAQNMSKISKYFNVIPVHCFGIILSEKFVVFVYVL